MQTNSSHLNTLIRTIQAFRTLDALVPAQTIEAYLIIAARGRVTRRDIAEALKMNSSTAFRNLVRLLAGEYTLNGTTYQGLGLVAKRPDPIESRRQEYYLSTKGERLRGQLLALAGLGT